MEFSKNTEFLKSIYTTDLYSIKEKPTVSTPTTNQEDNTVAYEGDGSSGVAILLKEPPSSEEKLLLEKILTSINTPLATTLLFTSRTSDIEQVLKDHSITKIVLFYPQDLSESFLTIQSHSLSDLLVHVEHKKALWTELKKHF